MAARRMIRVPYLLPREICFVGSLRGFADEMIIDAGMSEADPS